MKLYVPNALLKEVSAALTEEGVTFEVTGHTFSLVVEGKETYEVTEVETQLLETEIPAILDEAPPRKLRAFRLPSGRKILLTDVDGNYDRFAKPPPGWER